MKILNIELDLFSEMLFFFNFAVIHSNCPIYYQTYEQICKSLVKGNLWNKYVHWNPESCSDSDIALQKLKRVVWSPKRKHSGPCEIFALGFLTRIYPQSQGVFTLIAQLPRYWCYSQCSPHLSLDSVRPASILEITSKQELGLQYSEFQCIANWYYIREVYAWCVVSTAPLNWNVRVETFISIEN